jgi:Transcription initiation factor IIF, alpha subunit (TFIIF-alpha)
VTYRTLNAEEAEERFAERGKILNHFAVMVNKKVRQNQVTGIKKYLQKIG